MAAHKNVVSTLPPKAVSLLLPKLQEPNRRVWLNFCLVKKLTEIPRYWGSALINF